MKSNLDSEEKEILDAFEKGELKPARDSSVLQARLRGAARNTIKRLFPALRKIKIKESVDFASNIDGHVYGSGEPR